MSYHENKNKPKKTLLYSHHMRREQAVRAECTIYYANILIWIELVQHYGTLDFFSPLKLPDPAFLWKHISSWFEWLVGFFSK